MSIFTVVASLYSVLGGKYFFYANEDRLIRTTKFRIIIMKFGVFFIHKNIIRIFFSWLFVEHRQLSEINREME